MEDEIAEIARLNGPAQVGLVGRAGRGQRRGAGRQAQAGQDGLDDVGLRDARDQPAAALAALSNQHRLLGGDTRRRAVR